MDAATAAILGAGIGAVAGLGGAGIAAVSSFRVEKWRRKQDRLERAYLELLVNLSRVDIFFTSALRAYRDKTDVPDPGPVLDDFRESSERLLVFGSVEVGEAFVRVIEALGEATRQFTADEPWTDVDATLTSARTVISEVRLRIRQELGD